LSFQQRKSIYKATSEDFMILLRCAFSKLPVCPNERLSAPPDNGFFFLSALILMSDWNSEDWSRTVKKTRHWRGLSAAQKNGEVDKFRRKVLFCLTGVP
jgi:hypothetical protein